MWGKFNVFRCTADLLQFIDLISSIQLNHERVKLFIYSLGHPNWFPERINLQLADSKFSDTESMELLGVSPCPWITVNHQEIVHSVHYEHCFRGICSKTAVKGKILGR